MLVSPFSDEGGKIRKDMNVLGSRGPGTLGPLQSSVPRRIQQNQMMFIPISFNK